MKTTCYNDRETFLVDYPDVWDKISLFLETCGQEFTLDDLTFVKAEKFYAKFAETDMLHVHCLDSVKDNVVFEIFAFKEGLEVSQFEAFNEGETTAEIHGYFTSMSYV